MKTCIKCLKQIKENDNKEKWAMIITKLGQKIISFECFHFNCWKQFWDESVTLEIIKGGYKKYEKIK